MLTRYLGKIRGVEYGRAQYVQSVNKRHANKQLVKSENWSLLIHNTFPHNSTFSSWSTYAEEHKDGLWIKYI